MADAARDLAARDPDLAALLAAQGVPPLWHKGHGFETLVDIVLGQQVSLTSARNALVRVRTAAGGVTPMSVSAAGAERLRSAGITRQKAAYIVGLADAALAGCLDLSAISRLTDDAVIDALTALTGIGRWTADIYLLMGLGRPDIWPSTDLALILQVRSVRGLDHMASTSTITHIAEAWRPFRSVAARMLWQAYLIERGRPLD